LSFTSGAATQAGKKIADAVLSPSPPPLTREEADQAQVRAENWRMLSAPLGLAAGVGIYALCGGPVGALGSVAIIASGLLVASWRERERERRARCGG
jgi:hypothetical protein